MRTPLEINRIEFFFAVEGSFNVVAGQEVAQGSAQYSSATPHFGMLVFDHFVGCTLDFDGCAGFEIVERKHR